MWSMAQNRKVLLIVGFCSLGLIPLTDKYFFNLLGRFCPSLAVIADLRLTSLLLVTLIWILFGEQSQTGRSDNPFKPRSLLLPAIWLALTAYFVLVKQVWVPALTHWADYVAFMGTGLLAEELLFRGTLFSLCGKAFGFRKIGKFSAPVWISASLFSLQHLGYHGFQINSASVSQVTYALLMGLVFGSLREASGFLWPAIALHVITNLFTVIRSLG